MADEADLISMERFRAHDLKVDSKPDLSPVTEADRTIEQQCRVYASLVAHGGESHGSACQSGGVENQIVQQSVGREPSSAELRVIRAAVGELSASLFHDERERGEIPDVGA